MFPLFFSVTFITFKSGAALILASTKPMRLSILFISIIITMLTSCNSSGQERRSSVLEVKETPDRKAAIFAEGCFWCSEHIFDSLKGVDSVVSGYTGGHTEYPTYEEVCTETTGHAEAVVVYYNPKIVSFPDLLDVFFSSHDPTTLNRQGPDQGTSYRSAVFYKNEEEEQQIRKAIMKWTSSFEKPIVTEVAPFTVFYMAEDYHQNYAEQNPGNPYIKNVSMPRFDSFKRACKLQFKDKK